MRASTQVNGLTASILIVVLCACAATTHAQISFSSPQPAIELSVAGSYSTDDYDNSAAEIVAYDEVTENLYVTNSSDNALDVLSIANSLTPSLVDSIDLSDYGAGPNSVAISAGLIAVAVEADPAQEPGSVVFFNRAGYFLAEITVGPLPDMLVFTPNGEYLLVANEGEPDDDYVNDPEGSISIIEIASQQSALASSPVAVAGFAAFNNVDISPVRVFGPGASVAQDLEPEFIAVSADSKTAWVTLQENNGIAIIDIQSATVTDIVPLDYRIAMKLGAPTSLSPSLGARIVMVWRLPNKLRLTPAPSSLIWSQEDTSWPLPYLLQMSHLYRCLIAKVSWLHRFDPQALEKTASSGASPLVYHLLQDRLPI